MALYSESFRKRMVSTLTGPHAMTATVLSAEVGVAQSTLWCWLRELGTVLRTMPPSDGDKKAPSDEAAQDWTAEESGRWSSTQERSQQAEFGAYLCCKGVHEA